MLKRHRTPPAARRRSPRLRVTGEISIRFATSADPVLLHDISFEGFGIWTPDPVLQGDLRLFWLRVSDLEEYLLYGVCAHLGACPALDGRGHFSGWSVESEDGQNVLTVAVGVLTNTLTLRPELE